MDLGQLKELRLQCSELAAERIPFGPCVRSLKRLARLQKLTLFSRLDAASAEALAEYLRDPSDSRRLYKVKFSTSLISSPGTALLLDG